LGDVAILLKSRFSSAQTILCNGTINFLSLFGVITGLAAINLSEIAQMYIMVSVAGNFIYIASDIWQNLFKNTGDYSKCYNFI
jgi:zinc transporter ZupT